MIEEVDLVTARRGQVKVSLVRAKQSNPVHSARLTCNTRLLRRKMKALLVRIYFVRKSRLSTFSVSSWK